MRHNRCLIGYPVAAQEASSQPASASSGASPADGPSDASGASPGDDPSDASDRGDQPVVDHSLIWRFLSWLGGLTAVLDEARAMLLKSRPDSTCHRLDGNIDPHKARSPERLATLETARQLLQVIPEWEACFDCRFFPRFATRAGFD